MSLQGGVLTCHVPTAPCDKLALPLTHPVLEKCVCTYLVSLPVLLSHLCWPSMTASTTPLNTCRGETLMSWYVHNSPHCAASTGAIACMHCCYIVLYQCHVCWDETTMLFLMLAQSICQPLLTYIHELVCYGLLCVLCAWQICVLWSLTQWPVCVSLSCISVSSHCLGPPIALHI